MRGRVKTAYRRRFWLWLLALPYRLAFRFVSYVNVKREAVAAEEQIPVGTSVRIEQCPECVERRYVPDGDKKFGTVVRSYLPDHSAYEVEIDGAEVYVHAEHVNVVPAAGRGAG